MKRKQTINIVLILLIVLSGFLGYRLFTLRQAHSALEQDFEKITRRAKQLQKKYTAQKAQVTALQRSKLAVEGLKRQAEMKADALAKELEEKKAEIAVIEEKIGGRVKTLEARLAKIKNTLGLWKEKYTALSQSYKEAKNTIAEQNASIAKKKENIRHLESELQFANRTKSRYFSHNQTMAKTSQSILARYDEKGVFAKTILHVEPFTQIKKVELEQLIQTYMDKIDDNTIRDQQ